MPSVALGVVLLLCLLASACRTVTDESRPGAYVAPGTLNLRKDLSQKSTTGTMLNHGERVQILEVRRRFVKVRTQKGNEGWVDATQLLTPERMAQIQKDDANSLRLPSEGSAGVFEPLNIHIDPSRISPAFARIEEGEQVEVLAHKLSEKATGPLKAPKFAVQPVRTERRSGHKASAAKDAFPLPRIQPPKPPDDVDAQADSDAQADEKQAATGPAKPVAYEDWSLVRTSGKQVGWVLSRNLSMSIPDEVAQYAEGHRITSYFALTSVNDEEKGLKHDWLWTTLSGQESFDFDAWRVFIWNRKRHRYETSYRERNLEGYFPVHADVAGSASKDPTFQLIVKNENGKFQRKSYFLDGVRVHLTGVEPYDPAATTSGAATESKNVNDAAAKPSWLSGLWSKLRGRSQEHP